MAVKIMQSAGLGDEGQLDAFRREVQVLSALRHPHIVRLLGACLVLPHLCIVEELAMGGSLYDKLHGPAGNRCDCPLPYPQVCNRPPVCRSIVCVSGSKRRKPHLADEMQEQP